MDKYALIKKIDEGEQLTNEEKSAILELLRTQKKYGLVWEDKPEDVEERLRDELPVLTEVKDRAIISDDKKAPNHILIEGDNLEALTTLSYTHAGKIDVIYIDPPYNTGKKDFVYNDKCVDSEDSYKHSKWLSFINKRVKIAKHLLSDKGVIFISIDDNEQAQLKLLCDEYFGQRNFLAQVVWERAFSPINLMKHFSPSHDYILCYAKNIDIAICNGIMRSDEANERYSNPDNDPRGVWSSSDISVGPPIEQNIYPITTPSGRIVNPPSERSWRLSEVAFAERLKDNRIWFGPDGDGVPRIKRFLSELKKTGITPMTIWKHTEVGHSQGATQKLAQMFDGKKMFDYPKSVELIKRCIQLYSDENSIVLDFFAGSGTTMHATMQLNAEDGGLRQCILVTNNENNICEEVTYERNKRVIQGYTTSKGEAVAGLKANNLRYYKTDFVSRERTAKAMRQLVSLATDMLCIKEDLYNEVGIFGKQKTHKGLFRYFVDGEKKMLVIYREEVIEELAKEILNMNLDRPIKVYVFSPSEDPWEGMFEDVAEKVELCALPQAIYNAYRRALPKKRDKAISSETEEETEQANNN